MTDPHDMMAAYLEGELPVEQVEELEQWLRADRKRARAFVRLAMLHCQLGDELRDENLNAFASGDADASGFGSMLAALDDTKGEALQPVDISDVLKQREMEAKAKRAESHASFNRRFGRSVQQDSGSQTRHYVIPRPLFYGSIAAVVAVAAVIIWPLIIGPKPPQSRAPIEGEAAVVATLESSIDVHWDGQSRPQDDGEMREGTYSLTRGIARIRSKTGAILTIESPAIFNLLDVNAMSLQRGRLIGRVDTEEARGFIVETNSARFVDMGTEFGVIATGIEDCELHVFEGRVDGAVKFDDGSLGKTAAYRVNEAIRIAGRDRTVMAMRADQNLFEVTRAVDIAVHNTGIGRVVGATDRNWKITAVNGQPLEFPIQATVVEPPESTVSYVRFRKNRINESQWIAPQVSENAGDSSVTYETTFDVEGIELDSMRLLCRFVADNSVSRIILNGQDIDVPEHSDRPPFERFHQLMIHHGFVEGKNVISFVVSNAAASDSASNWTGFCAEFELVGRRTWQDMLRNHNLGVSHREAY